jgi:hypothetical protein
VQRPRLGTPRGISEIVMMCMAVPRQWKTNSHAILRGVIALAVIMTNVAPLVNSLAAMPSGAGHERGRFVRFAENEMINSSHDCAVRLKEFVTEMDDLLDQNRGTLLPLLDPLKRFFPLHDCDVGRVTQLSRTSKYFLAVNEQPRLYGFSFSNANARTPGSGFDVSFAVDKATGNTELHFASVHKGRAQ